MKKIIFITNGHGEDLVAAEIIKLIPNKTNAAVFPLVGEGKAFQTLNIKVLGSRKKLPGGGFSLRNLWFLAKDVYAGLLGDTIKHIKTLRKLRGEFDLVIAIGDVVPIIAALIIKTPFIFVGVNKSSYYKWFGFSYTPWEKLLLQSYALKVFVRDKQTEQDLTTRGIKIHSAQYVGNPLMDCVGQITNDQFPMSNEGQTIIGLLPGTREDAKVNLEDFEKIIKEIVKMKESDFKLRFLIATTLKNIPEYMKNKPFAEIITQSDLILGLSGTGNEQAAGLGIPIVSFYGRGSQYNKKFAKAQKQLLGDALSIVKDNDPLTIAAEIWHLLRHPEKRIEIGKIGKERMGEAGAAKIISAYITETLK